MRKQNNVSSQEVAIWCVRQNDFVTSEQIENQFNIPNERARRILRYLRKADRFKTEIRKVETSSGKVCQAVKITQIDRPYADCNKRQTEILRRGNYRPRASFRRANNKESV